MRAILEEAVRFAFKDRNWILKILIGGILGLIPIVNVIFILGYSLVVLRDSVENKPAVLPEWSGYRQYAKDGLYALLIVLVYFIPLILSGILANGSFLRTFFLILFILGHLIIVPLAVLALIAWSKKGALAAAFAFKDVWNVFAKEAVQYLVATLAVAVLPLLVFVIFERLGGMTTQPRLGLSMGPWAFIQLVLSCAWFWLALFGMRVYGQVYSTTQK